MSLPSTRLRRRKGLKPGGALRRNPDKPLKRTKLARGTKSLVNESSKMKERRARQRIVELVDETGERKPCRLGPALALAGWCGCTSWATDRHHRRKASQGGSDLEPNLVPCCRACNRVVEDDPGLADRASELAGWKLVVHDGDPEWAELGRKNDALRVRVAHVGATLAP